MALKKPISPTDPSTEKEKDSKDQNTNQNTNSSSDDEEGIGSEEVEESSDGEIPASTNVSDFTIKRKSPTPEKFVTKEKGSPKPLIVGIWDEESEMAILNGFIDYRTKNGVNPNPATFHEFTQNLLRIKVNKKQLWDKLRGLKKKYMNNIKKAVTFKGHDATMFELSHKIWGEGVVEACAGSGKRNAQEDLTPLKSEKKTKLENVVAVEDGSDEGFEVEDEEGFWEKYPRFKKALDEQSKKYGRDVTKCFRIGHKKAKEMEEKLIQVQAKKHELEIMKLNLVLEQTNMLVALLNKP